MSKNTHVNVTIDFRNWEAGIYDLRIPAHQSVKSLLLNLMDTLQIQPSDGSRFAIKVATKNLLLSDDDILLHYPVADGDLLTVL
ncbi:MAG TPA: EsaB/YukD family protein [Bacillota bacterium]|nr:EsaB/YukD family protein [Bacillota bacterium]